MFAGCLKPPTENSDYHLENIRSNKDSCYKPSEELFNKKYNEMGIDGKSELFDPESISFKRKQLRDKMARNDQSEWL